MLQYFGSARSVNALALLEERDDYEQQQRGYPLAASEMLLTTWKCPAMTHLAGYEQRDAHEFFHGFLDSLSKRYVRMGITHEYNNLHCICTLTLVSLNV